MQESIENKNTLSNQYISLNLYYKYMYNYLIFQLILCLTFNFNFASNSYIKHNLKNIMHDKKC